MDTHIYMENPTLNWWHSDTSTSWDALCTCSQITKLMLWTFGTGQPKSKHRKQQQIKKKRIGGTWDCCYCAAGCYRGASTHHVKVDIMLHNIQMYWKGPLCLSPVHSQPQAMFISMERCLRKASNSFHLDDYAPNKKDDPFFPTLAAHAAVCPTVSHEHPWSSLKRLAKIW